MLLGWHVCSAVVADFVPTEFTTAFKYMVIPDGKTGSVDEGFAASGAEGILTWMAGYVADVDVAQAVFKADLTRAIEGFNWSRRFG